MNDRSGHGLWSLVVLNSLVFIIFAFSFTRPRTSRDWRSFGAFSAFVVALFTQMYGFPLTIYFLLPWLSKALPGVDFLSHDAGHLLEMMFGWTTNPHIGPFHLVSNLLIVAGFILLSSSWQVLYKARKSHTVATEGPCACVRHPQYVAFILIMFGFLLQWPTIITLAMFPALVVVYGRLAKSEERDCVLEFGAAYEEYRGQVQAFIPGSGKYRLQRYQDQR